MYYQPDVGAINCDGNNFNGQVRTLVLPVPVTALSHTVPADMSRVPEATSRVTGIASCINRGSLLKIPIKKPGSKYRQAESECKQHTQRHYPPDKQLYFIFLILTDDIAHHRIAGAGKGPYKDAQHTEHIAHYITDSKSLSPVFSSQD